MVIVAIVRGAGMVRGGGSVDSVWVAFWQHQECSIAIIMVSVSAFRSLFVPSPTNLPIQRQLGYSPSEKRRKFMRRRPDPDLYDSHGTGALPQIPSRTLTGITTVIGEDRDSVETAVRGQHFHSQLPPSEDDRSTEKTTTDSSARDSELGLPTESILPNTHCEYNDAKPSRSRGTRWWKAFRQPDTARTASSTRTGYWDVLSFLRTGQSDSVAQSKDRSDSQL